jgi:hypothetical protein
VSEQRSVQASAVSHRGAASRARPIFADGRPTTGDDIQYSLARPKWWNLLGWIWRIKHTLMLLKEDRQWLKKSRAPSE